MKLQHWIGTMVLCLFFSGSCIGYLQPTAVPISSPTEQNIDYSKVEITVGSFLRTEGRDLITIELLYPQLSCPDNEPDDIYSVTSLVNQQIYEYVVKPEYSQWRPTRLNVDSNYTITVCADTIFSVLFEEHYSDVSGYYLTNSALVFNSAGVRLGLKDCIDVNTIYNQIEQQTLAFEVLFGPLPSDADSAKIEVYRLLLEFLSADEKEQSNNFYITESGIGIILLLDYPGMRENLIVEIDCDLIVGQ